MARRDDVLDVIIEYAKEHVGNSPSMRDLMLAMKKRGQAMSISTIRQHVTKLEAENRLERRNGKLIVVGANWQQPHRRTPGDESNQ
jgi:Fe2+ or Zn2+ uptake regulation protein